MKSQTEWDSDERLFMDDTLDESHFIIQYFDYSLDWIRHKRGVFVLPDHTTLTECLFVYSQIISSCRQRQRVKKEGRETHSINHDYHHHLYCWSPHVVGSVRKTRRLQGLVCGGLLWGLPVAGHNTATNIRKKVIASIGTQRRERNLQEDHHRQLLLLQERAVTTPSSSFLPGSSSTSSPHVSRRRGRRRRVYGECRVLQQASPSH